MFNTKDNINSGNKVESWSSIVSGDGEINGHCWRTQAIKVTQTQEANTEKNLVDLHLEGIDVLIKSDSKWFSLVLLFSDL